MLPSMARVVPKSITGRLSFFTVHAERWAQDPAAIGLTGEDVAALQAALDAATAARLTAEGARLAAESATLAQSLAVEALVSLGANLIAKVRVAAAVTDNTGVYTLAGLPAPSGPTRSDIPPPAPRELTLTPLGTGAVRLAWASDLKRTSFYRIDRAVTSPGAPDARLLPLSGVRDNAFTDTSLPVGFARVEYLVTPVRQRRGGRPVEGHARRVQYTPGTVAPRPTLAHAPPTALHALAA